VALQTISYFAYKMNNTTMHNKFTVLRQVYDKLQNNTSVVTDLYPHMPPPVLHQ